MRTHPARRTGLAALLGLLLSGTAVWAQPASPAPADTASSPAAAAAAEPLPNRFAIHGYLTQGWAQSTGTAFYGMSNRPSSDFRYAAVQARFRATEKDLFLVQLNHRRLGRSPITDFESDVNLNWAFYQRTLGTGTTVKVGRIAIPRGIYNELRSVGVALPTYRPPVVFYDEGAYYSETIDGAVVSHRFAEEAAWSLDAHLYGGGWRSLAYDTWSESYGIARVRAENAVGAQLWLHTPAEGVRVGVAAQRYDYDWDSDVPYEVKEWHVSLDATRERGFLRTEAQLQNYGQDKFYSGYVQLGARVTPRLTLTGEVQRSRDTDVQYGEGLPASFEWHRSDGLGAAFAIAPNFVLKAEHHWDRGIQVEQPADPMRAPRFRYAILSLSASF
ncbi:hypothetical protein [Roseisolibacter sp. H3M3-2]|uniref:hypothetical protein n=1 Tax=Roseisolibacter sp. H3M3-2 TaxID=3031323 RepID=UPI0023DB8D3F|nr:hypothetical protein [Roseisolibacter sp. H3M3-2]MDF1503667.1 hypothetical protein [Roseisolibacter sp. H3M3-2]